MWVQLKVKIDVMGLINSFYGYNYWTTHGSRFRVAVTVGRRDTIVGAVGLGLGWGTSRSESSIRDPNGWGWGWGLQRKSRIPICRRSLI